MASKEKTIVRLSQIFTFEEVFVFIFNAFNFSYFLF